MNRQVKSAVVTLIGLPVLVVLDSDGKRLTIQETGQLEAGNHHDPAKVLAFLEKWKKPRGPGGK